MERNKFQLYKSPTSLRDVDTDKVFVSKKISSGERNYKYLIGYLYNDHKVKPLHIRLPKIGTYLKSHDRQTK